MADDGIMVGLQPVIDSFPNPALAVDAEGGILACNLAARVQFGTTRKPEKLNRIEDFKLPPDVTAALRRILEEAESRREGIVGLSSILLGHYTTLDLGGNKGQATLIHLHDIGSPFASGCYFYGWFRNVVENMANVSGYVDLLKFKSTWEESDPETLDGFLDGLGREMDIHRHLHLLIRDMQRRVRDASLFGDGTWSEFERVDLKEAMAEAVRCMTSDEKSLISIETTVSPSLLPIRAEKAPLIMVIRRLIARAMAAADGAGVIKMSADMVSSIDDQVPIPEEIAPACCCARICIADNGRPMTHKEFRSLTEFPMEQIKLEGGEFPLAVVPAVIGRYGGTIDVRSTKEEGTEFSLYLQCWPEGFGPRPRS